MFELYNLTGNGDLTVQTNALPLAPPFFQTSQNRGANPEIHPDLHQHRADQSRPHWYFLGVPNHEINNINYTIVAEILTNVYFPAFPGAKARAAARWAPATRARSAPSITSLTWRIPAPARCATPSAPPTVRWSLTLAGIINLASPLVITNSYLTIAGQTAPGGGITVAGNMTTVTNAHDVIIRDVRFRRGARRRFVAVHGRLQCHRRSHLRRMDFG